MNHAYRTDRRVVTARGALLVVGVLFLLAAIFTLTGCSADKDAALAANTRERQAVVAGGSWIKSASVYLDQIELSAVPFAEFWGSLREIVPEPQRGAIDRVLAGGGDGLAEARRLLALAEVDRDRILAAIDARRAEIEAMPDDAEFAGQVFRGVAETTLGVIAGPTGVAIVGLVSTVLGHLLGKRKGRTQGAGEVAAIIATGRVVSPEFNGYFVDDAGPVSAAMRARLAESEYAEVPGSIRELNKLAQVSKAPALLPSVASAAPRAA